MDARPEAALRSYLAGHGRGRLGRIAYEPADVGVGVEDLRVRFAPYVRRFLA